MLGWEPAVELDEGLEKTIAWYREKTLAVRLGWPDVGEPELAEVAERPRERACSRWARRWPSSRPSSRARARSSTRSRVTSGTAALHLAVLALGLEPGDEVLVPAYTFPATGERRRARRPEAGARRRRSGDDEHRPGAGRGRPAHEGGARRAPLRPACAAARSCPSELLVLEDAAGALGARYRGRACGGLGLLGCLSFHPRKIVTTGEGGAVTTNDDAHRRGGARRSATTAGARSRRPTCRRPGLNYRLSDILCAVGIPQLRRLDELLAERTRDRRRLQRAAARTCRCSCRAPTTATSTAGRPTSSRSTTATACSPGCARRGSRRRSAPTRCTGSAPTATRARSPGAARVFERALALPFHTRLERRRSRPCGRGA